MLAYCGLDPPALGRTTYYEIYPKYKLFCRENSSLNLICKMTAICVLTHWGRVMHICVGNLTIIGSDNGLAPDRRQAIIWTSDGILWIRPLGTNFNEILIEFLTFWFKKMRLNVSSAKWRPFFLNHSMLSAVSCYVPWLRWSIMMTIVGEKKQSLPRIDHWRPENQWNPVTKRDQMMWWWLVSETGWHV